MNAKSYEMYAKESSSWLHKGRQALVKRAILAHLSATNKPIEILEVGAGVGQNIAMLSQFGQVDAVEIEPAGLKALSRKKLRKIIPRGIPCKLQNKYDIICALDVIEHLENDREAVAWISAHLKPSGIFIATVPAFQWLFSDHDRALGHYRRYTSRQFRSLATDDLEIASGSYFNTMLFPLAVVARCLWMLKNRLKKSDTRHVKQSVHTGKTIDKLLLRMFLFEIKTLGIRIKRPFGLSYYACFKKRR